jgi:hypothetical protein
MARAADKLTWIVGARPLRVNERGSAKVLGAVNFGAGTLDKKKKGAA